MAAFPGSLTSLEVSVAVLEDMLAPYVSSGHLTVLLDHRPSRLTSSGDSMRSVQLRGPGGVERTVSARYFLDATEQGDLLPLAKRRACHRSGIAQRYRRAARAGNGAARRTSNRLPSALPSIIGPARITPSRGLNEYAFWRDYVPQLQARVARQTLSWSMANPQTLELRRIAFDPTGDQSKPGEPAELVAVPPYRPSEELSAGDIRQRHHAGELAAKRLLAGRSSRDSPSRTPRTISSAPSSSASRLLYWMQTEAGWPGLRLRHDVTDTEDGLAKYPYVRESRRIQAEFTVLEQHVGDAAARKR